jgi:Magnesium chelatase, subunit ChlI
MLARRLTTILPAMTFAEALETTRIRSVAGLTGEHTALVTLADRSHSLPYLQVRRDSPPLLVNLTMRICSSMCMAAHPIAL